jgi:hypothetical protein
MLGAFVFFAAAMWAAYDALDPLGRWDETTGVVTEVKSRSSSGDTFVVSFSAPDGSGGSVWAGGDKIAGHFAVGERISVRYRVSDSHDAHIADSPTRSVIAVIALLGAGVGCVFLARAKGLHWSGL